jgi:hypothetical protein
MRGGERGSRRLACGPGGAGGDSCHGPATLGRARMNSSKSLFQPIFQTDLDLNLPIGGLPKLENFK